MRTLTHTATATAVVLAIAAAPADAATTVVRGNGEPAIKYQRWVDQSKAPTPDTEVTVHIALCPYAPNANGCVLGTGIWMHPDRLAEPHSARIHWLHEIGHVFDALYMTDSRRARFSAIFGDTRPYWYWQGPLPEGIRPGPRTLGPPSERFAQAYSECAIHGRTIERRPKRPVKYRYRPSVALHEQACLFIRRVARQKPST